MITPIHSRTPYHDDRGNNGKDEIYGGADSDAIEGGYHEDTISGGSGNDILWGFEATQSNVDMHADTDEAKFRKIGAFSYTGEWNANEIDDGAGDDYLIGSGEDMILLSKPQLPSDDIFSEYYMNPDDPWATDFHWEFHDDRISFNYKLATTNADGDKVFIDQEGAALHITGAYDMNDIQYVDDYAYA